MSDAPKTIWAIPTRWADRHGPDIDWSKGDWHKRQSKSPLCMEYARADTVAARLKAADELADVLSVHICDDKANNTEWMKSALTAYRATKEIPE